MSREWNEFWMQDYLQTVRDVFGERVRFVGLQGSRARGEARPGSDIDVVLLLDELRWQDVLSYRCAIEGLPLRELVCGFVSGVEELAAWDAGELVFFYHDTVPVFGSLDFVRPLFGPRDVLRAVRQRACGICHAAVHNGVHARSADALREICKSAIFVLRAAGFAQTGQWVFHTGDLEKVLRGEDLEAFCAARAFLENPCQSSRRLTAFLGCCWAGRRGLQKRQAGFCSRKAEPRKGARGATAHSRPPGPVSPLFRGFSEKNRPGSFSA